MWYVWGRLRLSMFGIRKHINLTSTIFHTDLLDKSESWFFWQQIENWILKGFQNPTLDMQMQLRNFLSMSIQVYTMNRMSILKNVPKNIPNRSKNSCDVNGSWRMPNFPKEITRWWIRLFPKNFANLIHKH